MEVWAKHGMENILVGGKHGVMGKAWRQLIKFL
jgi:hypothetical protein